MISMNWVKDYVDLEGEDLKELAVKITKAGVNIEKVITNHIDNLVVGEILEVEKHPDSDHLNVCKVNTGEIRQIVCGASNVRPNLKVIVALPGAILPGNFEIKKGVIRGVESDGMICALFELGLEEKTEEAYAKGITELGSDAKVGTDPLKYLGLDDTLYDVDIHKHRNNDCYYHIGFAYEVGTIIGKKVTKPESNYKEIKDNINDEFKLKVATDLCPFYLAKKVKNVKIKQSPDFIQKRLISAGMRPINNVVDISNYVMLEYGQPTHFFDADKLGSNVLVRNAKEFETIITLDGKNRDLKTKDIVITDGDKPVCIAGVMGGENTEVDENTKNILIEAAIFDAVAIRNTAARLDLKSEASIRYGKGLNFEYTIEAMNRACALLEKYADGEVLSGEVLHDKVDKSIKTVEFKTEDINKILGIKITDEDVKKELERLDFPYTYKDTFKVEIPRRRLDIDPNVADMAEEIGRLYGYHNLVSTLPKAGIRKGVYVGDVKIRKEVSKRLRSLGLTECKNYTLINPDMAKLFKYEERNAFTLPNPMSVDKSIIRISTLPSLLENYKYNKLRKVNDICIYEIAKTYDDTFTEDVKVGILMKGNYLESSWNKAKVEVDFYLVKGVLESVLDYLGFKNRYALKEDKIADIHPGVSARVLLDREEIGIIGKVHPSIVKDDVYVIELSLTKLLKDTKPIKYKPSSIYPEVNKDLAFIVKDNITSKEIEDVMKKAGSRLLTNIEVFDVYKGENVKEDEKSIAYSLTFSDPTKTLTDEEVTEVFKHIISEVEKNLDAKLRDK